MKLPIGIAVGRHRHERAKLELLLTQLTSSLVWTTDVDLVVTSAFGGALDLIGVSGPDLVGKSVEELTAPTADAGAAILDAHRRALEGQADDITEQWGTFPFDLHFEPLYEDGTIVGVGGIAVDASKRRAAEQALVESEARFRTLVERLPICTYINPLGLPIRTTYMSPYVEKLLGFPVERWLNEPDFFVTRLHPDDLERVLASAHRTHEDGEPFRESYRLIAKDGRVVHLLDETIPVSDERGRPLFLQGFFIELDTGAVEELHSATG
ncbi:MAG TPA: PAS domain-containing protein [Gaiellaceae bacterium]|nr:PAS domain-containing protein [Gaiellaceae bacterium]